MQTLQGKPRPRGRIAVLASRFNETVTERLLQGALQTLRQYGCSDNDVLIVKVPGAFEIPLVARELAASGNYAALVCVGCVIRGETPHFDYICAEMARGIADVMRDFRVPVGFGVLTANTLDQALDRAGRKMGNKGSEAAEVALEMADLLAELRQSNGHSS